MGPPYQEEEAVYAVEEYFKSNNIEFDYLCKVLRIGQIYNRWARSTIYLCELYSRMETHQKMAEIRDRTLASFNYRRGDPEKGPFSFSTWVQERDKILEKAGIAEFWYKIERDTSGGLYSFDRLVNRKKSGQVLVDYAVACRRAYRHFLQKPYEIYHLTPRNFELFIASVMSALGYQVHVTQITRDGGYDIAAYTRTDIGTFLTLIDCKKWRTDRPVGIGVVRSLRTVIEDQGASLGMIVTTSGYTKDALKYQEDHRFKISLKQLEHIRQAVTE